MAVCCQEVYPAIPVLVFGCIACCGKDILHGPYKESGDDEKKGLRSPSHKSRECAKPGMLLLVGQITVCPALGGDVNLLKLRLEFAMRRRYLLLNTCEPVQN